MESLEREAERFIDLLKSDILAGKSVVRSLARDIVEILSAQRLKDRSQSITLKDLAASLKLSLAPADFNKTSDSVRLAMSFIRKQLEKHFAENPDEPVRVTIPERDYRFAFGFAERVSRPSRSQRVQPSVIDKYLPKVPLCMNYKTDPYIQEEYFNKAFSSGKAVTYITVMTGLSFKKIDNYLSPETKLTVLVWNPRSAKEISYRAEFTGEKDDKVRNVQDALEEWDKRAEAHSNIRLLEYPSWPGIQGLIVENDYALIEITPFQTPPDFRPALLLRADHSGEKQAFEFFVRRLEPLMRSPAHRRIPGARSSWFISEASSTDSGDSPSRKTKPRRSRS